MTQLRSTGKILFFLSLIISFKSQAQTDTVVMENMSFKPASLTISKGTTVLWVNKTQQDHTSTSGVDCAKDGNWDSGYINAGKTYSRTFDAEGTFNYFCTPHCLSGMKGIILVKEAKTNSDSVKKKEPPTENQQVNKTTEPSFKGLDVINAVTTNTLGKNVLDFTIYHRFDDLTGARGGPQTFFGLDNIRDIRLSLAYGLTKNVTVGISRTKGDWFNSPYQEVRNIYDGSVKIALCSQTNEHPKIPMSITLYGNTAYSAMKRLDVEGSEANFKSNADRFSYSAQAIIAHNFKRHLSLQVMPIYVRRNWVNTSAGGKDEPDLFSLGGGLRWGFSQRIALVAEYFHTFSAYRQANPDIFFDPLAVGLEINTGGHIFHINLSNATGLLPNTYLPYTTSSWLKNGFRLGFSISRKFVLDKKARKVNAQAKKTS
jgi:plastocyanin